MRVSVRPKLSKHLFIDVATVKYFIRIKRSGMQNGQQVTNVPIGTNVTVKT